MVDLVPMSETADMSEDGNRRNGHYLIGDWCVIHDKSCGLVPEGE